MARSAKGKRRNNGGGASLAEEVSVGFHGRPAIYREDIVEVEKYRTNLAHLGDLVELEVVCRDGRNVIPISFPEHDTEGHVSVASSVDRKQLLFGGGDQELELQDLDIPDDELQHDMVMVGECYSISYFTDKHHLTGPKYQRDGTEYMHTFGEESGGVRPHLCYDRLNKRMFLVGGSYEVRDEGIYN